MTIVRAGLTCLVAVTALLSGVGPASASAPRLVFTAEGTPYSGLVGTVVNFRVSDAGEPVCSALYYESQLADDRSKDQVSLAGFSRDECASHEFVLAANFRGITFVWNGAVLLRGKATIAGPGPCVYGFANLITTLEIPGISLTAYAPVKGSLVRNRSSLYCAPLDTADLEVNFDKGEGEFLQSQLWG
jgi:hypothetical protein